jgi:hypothetical protein
MLRPVTQEIRWSAQRQEPQRAGSERIFVAMNDSRSVVTDVRTTFQHILSSIRVILKVPSDRSVNKNWTQRVFL